jgi:large subunit ribosomal protein L31e
MAKEKKSEPKVILEREYIVPLRSEWLKAVSHKRANKAVKALKQFMVQHMKIYDRDLRKIKIEQALNNEIRFRGMKKPPAKIKVLAKKYDDDIVRVFLVDIPAHVKFERLREEKAKAEIDKKGKASSVSKETESHKKEDKTVETKKEEKEESEEKKTEAKEKEEASRDEGLKLAKDKALEQKHVTKDNKVMMPRKTLSR